MVLTLSTLFLLQSCSVYNGKTATVDEIILSGESVKVKCHNGDIYKFEKLVREDGEIYGIAYDKGRTARKMSEQIVDRNLDDKLVKIVLSENTIKECHLQNKGLSDLIPNLFSVLVADY
jgi:hypothetical protein